MDKLFGTDGMRGHVNVFPMTVDVVLKTGLALGSKLLQQNVSHKPRIVIGKDTRLSNYAFENALCAGLLAAGTNVLMVGPLPTPGVSFLTKSMRCDAGIIISASHNGYCDNGIKIFDSNGFKISNEMQHQLTNMVLNGRSEDYYCHCDVMGRATRIDDVVGRYAEYVKNVFPRSQTLNSMKIVIDAANGAAHKIAAEILWELGAEVIAIGDKPNGYNINHGCGSTYPEAAVAKVLEHQADIGITLDGDADRLILVDECGLIANGDQILAALATDLKRTKTITNPIVIGTTVSNSNLATYISSLDMTFIRTSVGDRNVFEAMKTHSSSIGGERSGHIILKDYATTGDGMMVALKILGIMLESNLKASQVLRVFPEKPQLEYAIKYQKKLTDNDLAKIDSAIAEAEEKIKQNDQDARIVKRLSGTGPIIRITIESAVQQDANSTGDWLQQKINQLLEINNS